MQNFCSCRIRRKVAEDKLGEVEEYLNDEFSTKNAEIVMKYINEVEKKREISHNLGQYSSGYLYRVIKWN